MGAGLCNVQCPGAASDLLDDRAPLGLDRVILFFAPLNQEIVDRQLESIQAALTQGETVLVLLQGTGLADTAPAALWPLKDPALLAELPARQEAKREELLRQQKTHEDVAHACRQLEAATSVMHGLGNVFGSAFNLFASPSVMADLRFRLCQMSAGKADGTLICVEYATCAAKNTVVLNEMALEGMMHQRWVGDGKHVHELHDFVKDKPLAQYYRLYVAFGGTWKPEPPFDYLLVHDFLEDFPTLDMRAWRQFKTVQSQVTVKESGIFVFDSPDNLRYEADGSCHVATREDVSNGGYFVVGLPDSYEEYRRRFVSPAISNATRIGEVGKDGKGSAEVYRPRPWLNGVEVVYVNDGTDYDNNMATAALLQAWPLGKPALKHHLTTEVPNLAFPRATLAPFPGVLNLKNEWVGYQPDAEACLAVSGLRKGPKDMGEIETPIAIVYEEPRHGPILQAMYTRRNQALFTYMGLGHLYEVIDAGNWSGLELNVGTSARKAAAIPGWLYRPMYLAAAGPAQDYSVDHGVFCSVEEIFARQVAAQTTSAPLRAAFDPFLEGHQHALGQRRNSLTVQGVSETVADKPTVRGLWGALQLGWEGVLCARIEDASSHGESLASQAEIVPWPFGICTSGTPQVEQRLSELKAFIEAHPSDLLAPVRRVAAERKADSPQSLRRVSCTSVRWA